jgi:(E)-4-hydroxy-3-methyl-but-2-enyl pyrophosphate reductase (IPP and DMAPP forming)
MNVTLDPHSGFCFGVKHAIDLAERELNEKGKLYSLGDIVHNDVEVDRLKDLGLIIIGQDDVKKLNDCTVLIRAHGEPPETYQIAFQNNITLIDATCPIVLHLQNEIRQAFLEMEEKNGQVVIYGRKGHAEVNGLNGQTKEKAIIISDKKEIGKIDFQRPVRLYAQTTMNLEGFHEIVAMIDERMKIENLEGITDFVWNDTVCRQVASRSGMIKDFAPRFDVVIYVCGQKSSNGMYLYEVCKSVNPATYFVSGKNELRRDWFESNTNVGVCGATSTPVWLMEEIGEEIRNISG